MSVSPVLRVKYAAEAETGLFRLLSFRELLSAFPISFRCQTLKSGRAAYAVTGVVPYTLPPLSASRSGPPY